MFNVGDQVRIMEPFTGFPQLLHQVGIITEATPPNNIVDVAMYDIHIGNEVYVFFDDEVQLIAESAQQCSNLVIK